MDATVVKPNQANATRIMKVASAQGASSPQDYSPSASIPDISDHPKPVHQELEKKADQPSQSLDEWLNNPVRDQVAPK